MEKLIVTIDKTHLIDNDYLHGACDKINGGFRMCPLHEALSELFPSDIISVAITYVKISNPQKLCTHIYKIPYSSWNAVSVREHIKECVNHKEYSVEVELLKATNLMEI